MKRVAIIIVNYNGWQDTIDCLKSISHLNLPDIKLHTVVIDNDSSNDSYDQLTEFITKEEELVNVELVKLSSNLGFSGGTNVGIKSAIAQDDDYIMLLNNDTTVDLDLVTELVKAANKKAGIVVPKIYFAKGYEYHKGRYTKAEQGKVIWYAGGQIDWNNMYASHRGVDEVDKGQYDVKEQTEFASGCCMLVSREVFEEVGYLDDDLFLYLEDLDFCLRSIKEGYEIIYKPKAMVWHKNASSSDKPGSKLHQYYLTRNRLIVGMRYAPIRTRVALLKESLKFFQKGGVLRKAVRDYYLYNWGKWEN
ncbi:glycosyl transferase [Candidatus Roizmanbacteria bacterium CG22_combo_CG10-13_8_21_14_all_38_20]|uniref:Glycosyl transferase n=1 Tax=Candidatus Roizmanbacteria bacterium CG22_combo_CG10-13_8_21_14_all_38_20 TaxID=1974862 RepID=A0A2H0BVK9_9BACT|nr:glycosyltransferase family 2 protein [Candidatus Microgenomates bacterium]PIP61726.1 MAG: glycosyl transferase [Candidatus Roizmanbacteria bacterium CG22_combo_CG10-13_8_21_14_all_38_20]PJC32033.1 MAG: glycosyltransferase family 2 protein [Candidatus Roizmanbacteria bacterium CG_4_9_14_0_2_um_filter_38_17]